MIKCLMIFFGLAFGLMSAQLKEYALEDLETLQKNEPRNAIIFLHTDWCQYCKMMEFSTFKNQELSQVINQNYYFLKLNAEEKRDIHFGGKTFRYKPSGMGTGINELAEILAQEHAGTYPLLVILNPKNEIIAHIAGLQRVKDLVQILSAK